MYSYVHLYSRISLYTLYLQAEVDQLNASRPPDDPLVITHGGLLRDHCCFPNCPYYLADLRTARDKVLGSRDGLTNHLKFFFVPDRNYLPGLHLMAHSYFSSCVRGTQSKPDFAKFMRRRFKQYCDYKHNQIEWEETFESLYDQRHEKA